MKNMTDALENPATHVLQTMTLVGQHLYNGIIEQCIEATKIAYSKRKVKSDFPDVFEFAFNFSNLDENTREYVSKSYRVVDDAHRTNLDMSKQQTAEYDYARIAANRLCTTYGEDAVTWREYENGTHVVGVSIDAVRKVIEIEKAAGAKTTGMSDAEAAAWEHNKKHKVVGSD